VTAPRNPKELMRLLLADPQLRRELHAMVMRVDQTLEQESLASLRQAISRGDIDLRLLSHADVSDALSRYYREIKLAGEFVRMW